MPSRCGKSPRGIRASASTLSTPRRRGQYPLACVPRGGGLLPGRGAGRHGQPQRAARLRGRPRHPADPALHRGLRGRCPACPAGEHPQRRLRRHDAGRVRRPECGGRADPGPAGDRRRCRLCGCRGLEHGGVSGGGRCRPPRHRCRQQPERPVPGPYPHLDGQACRCRRDGRPRCGARGQLATRAPVAGTGGGRCRLGPRREQRGSRDSRDARRSRGCRSGNRGWPDQRSDGASAEAMPTTPWQPVDPDWASRVRESFARQGS